MMEKESLLKEILFFSWPFSDKKYQLFILKDENNHHLAFGRIIQKNKEGIWEEDKEGIWIDDPREWARHFIKEFGCEKYIKREDINVEIREGGKEITFTGDFGMLIIDEKSNLQYVLAGYQDPSV